MVRDMTTKKKTESSENVESRNKSEEKICFVIMPIADMAGYEPGHYGRVYEHLLKPAIIGAGYIPVRADDTSKTDYIVVGIIQKIVESDMVVCDLSGRNANVMYELGIRHAFNKPVVLIKDICTEKVFDVQGLRYTLYNESLRIDSVQKDIAKIQQSIVETAGADSADMNSIVRLAGIHPAEAPGKTEISAETQVLLSAIQSIESRMNYFEGAKSTWKGFATGGETPIYIATKTGVSVTLGSRVSVAGAGVEGVIASINSKTGIVRVRDDAGMIYSFNLFGETPPDFESVRD